MNPQYEGPEKIKNDLLNEIYLWLKSSETEFLICTKELGTIKLKKIVNLPEQNDFFYSNLKKRDD